MMRFACTILLMLLAACSQGGETSSCTGCHRGLEPVSRSHPSCTACHGGTPEAVGKEAAHRTLRGGSNPSAPAHWETSCGGCHPYQLQRVQSTLMHTNTGMIRNIQLTWEGEDGRLYAAREGMAYDTQGRPVTLSAVAGLDNLSGELYRKFCARCHIGTENPGAYAASHAAGCAACHFPWNEEATYTGTDPTMRGKFPRAASHRLEPLPGIAVCARCHNRSGRIALSYTGLNDGNNGLVPTDHGEPGPVMISGARNATHIAPDVHFEKGMECIDCHTSRDVMGDGYAYRNLYHQVEIACEDCHGSPASPPKHRAIDRENDEALRESRNYRQQVPPGTEMVLTARGRRYSNVLWRSGQVLVQGKRDGALHVAKVITGTPEHLVAGHGRMACTSCHSRTVVQCYGCHTKYDRGATSYDVIKGKETPGAFSETEDYRTLYPFPLALDQRGRIATVTPGCQTFVTVQDHEGALERNEYVARFKGRNQLRFAPFFSHNTGRKAIGCRECHANPAFLGFGQHVVEGDSIRATLLCEKSDKKPLDGFLSLDKGTVRAFSAITRERSRPLNATEIRRVLAVNQCLICHDNGRDPIFRKRIDYRALDDTRHRRLLADHLR